MAAPFKGVIKLDVRDSTPDWTPFTLKKAPEGAPNILIVLYDDTASPPGRRSAAASTCRRCRSSQTAG